MSTNTGSDRKDGARRDRPSGLSGPQKPRLGLERRSSPRMQSFDYVGAYAYSITISAAARHRAFVRTELVEGCVDLLQEAAEHHQFQVHAYCFMPDHVHLLVEGRDDASLVAFIKRFKQRSAFSYKRRTGMSLWQRSYYDHTLRHEDRVAVVAEYIWNNPVRAGLVENVEEYPFMGPSMSIGPDRPEGLSLQTLADEAKAPSLLPVYQGEANA